MFCGKEFGFLGVGRGGEFIEREVVGRVFVVVFCVRIGGVGVGSFGFGF